MKFQPGMRVRLARVHHSMNPDLRSHVGEIVTIQVALGATDGRVNITFPRAKSQIGYWIKAEYLEPIT